MKKFSLARILASAAVVLALAIGVGVPVPDATRDANAATPNYAVGTGVSVIVLPLHISGQYTASTTAVARFTIPFAAQVIGVSASARASGGTSPTLTVDVKEAGVTILSAPIAVTAGAVAEGTITDTALADEAAITVDLAITGTTPTWNDITVLIVLVRSS